MNATRSETCLPTTSVAIGNGAEESQEEGGDEPFATQLQSLALTDGDGCHRDRGDGEAIGDRPLRWHHAELGTDHDPGRSPDRREDDEWEGDRAEARDRLMLHSAATSFPTASASESQLVTSRISPGPQS